MPVTAGPFSPNAMEGWQAAMFAIMAGMNIGLMRSAPRWIITSVSVAVSMTPPPPVATTTPTSQRFSSVTSNVASAIACCAHANENCENRAARRECRPASFLSK